MSLKQNQMLRNILQVHLHTASNPYRFSSLKLEKGLQEDLQLSDCIELVLQSLEIEEVQKLLEVYYE